MFVTVQLESTASTKKLLIVETKESIKKKRADQKYLMTLRWLAELAPNLKVCELDKRSYQSLINEYAKTHEKQTTMDFHHHLKSAILDAIDEGLLSADPTRKVIIKGKTPATKKPKFLSQHELKSLVANLNLGDEPNWDWFILLIAKTGARFSEALALTPSDFDFEGCKIKITKTWNYKSAEAWSFKCNHYARNVSAYNSGARKSR